MSRRSTRKNKTYFLSCRDTAKAVPGLSHHQANDINLALVELDDVIEIVRLGDKRQGGKATEFRYLLPLNGQVDATDLQQRSASSMQAPVQA
jgi:hypothetical protein